jgi:hypothetical protein
VKLVKYPWLFALIVLIIVLIIFNAAFFQQAYSNHRDEIEQNMVATYYQSPNSTVNLNAGGYSIALASPASSSIPNLGFELISANSPVLGSETSILSLNVFGNTSQQMELLAYYENNGTLFTTGHGSIISLPTNGFQYPIQKLVAQYSTGSFVIANQYLKYGINASIYYNNNYNSLAMSGFGLNNVLSAYNFSITPKYGMSVSSLSLNSPSQDSFLQIFFSPKNYVSLSVGDEFINVTGKEVILTSFSSASLNLATFTKSDIMIPYNFISSVNLNLLSSSLDYLNGTASVLDITGGNGDSYNSTENFSIQSRTSVQFTLNPYLKNKETYLQYHISTNFAQVYANGSAIFYGPPQYDHGPLYRKTVALIEGSMMGAIVTTIFGAAKEIKSMKLAKGL